jgi:tryptophan halogenase
MLNLNQATRIVVLGGGTAGWFAAMTLRRIYSPQVEIQVIESSKIGIAGINEGGLLNFIPALQHNGINVQEFIRETGAMHKWGFVYEGWRTGQPDDKYYHLFASAKASASQWHENHFFPYFAAMLHQKIPLHKYLYAARLVLGNATQAEATALLESGTASIIPSFQFDSLKIANYFKRIALARGVKHRDAIVDDVVRDERGHVTHLCIGEEQVAVDFLIDASGLSRQVHAKTFGAQWRSFKDYLLMDRVLPFHMPHPQKNPALVTRAIAMNAGWMWQIALQERVGAGYVFSSAHLSEDQALAEMEKYLGFPVDEPQKTLKYESGCYENVWIGNVVALGLSSGFVEPLEAASSGQMLEELRNLERVLLQSRGVVSDKAIREFNEGNLRSWLGIRDFLRMHYDGTRADTELWRDVPSMPLPDSYREIRECWQERTPRMLDIENYAINGWASIFHVINWMQVGGALGNISVEGAAKDLMSLALEKRKIALDYANQLKG